MQVLLFALIVCDDQIRHILWNDSEESECLRRREVIFCGQGNIFKIRRPFSSLFPMTARLSSFHPAAKRGN